MGSMPAFDNSLAHHIWETRYRWHPAKGRSEVAITDTWRRVAMAVASVEEAPLQESSADAFMDILQDFTFLPGGRILAGAGTDQDVTLFNCFVMGLIPDSVSGIFDAVREGAITLQKGGGIGYDFSTLRPHGELGRTSGTIAAGPVPFMEVWDAMCATMLSTSARGGAMMATLRCDHPDIEAFIDAKRTPAKLTHFNLSVQVTDAFMEAVRKGESWPLVFPGGETATNGEVVHRAWTGWSGLRPCRVMKVIRARDLWQQIMRSAHACSEPGVLFVDRINHWNNLGYCERITATNPCGEIPLPPYGACDLGSVNLARLVHRPFTESAAFDWKRLDTIVATATRFLDNVIDLSLLPLPAQGEQVRKSRRIGLGVTGLADSLAMLSLHYDSGSARTFAERVLRRLALGAYRTSVALAQEKGPFPALEKDAFLRTPFIAGLPEPLRRDIRTFGIRNSHLVAIAPAGSISLLAGNVSSGIEPIFRLDHRRKVLEPGGDGCSTYVIRNWAYQQWRMETDESEKPPNHFVTAEELDPKAHLAMQSAVQRWVDNAISKTINVPESCTLESFQQIYELAFTHGLKGCTVFRPTDVSDGVLTYAE